MVYRLPPITESCQSDEGGSDHREGMGSNYDAPTSSESLNTPGSNPGSTPLSLQATNKLNVTEGTYRVEDNAYRIYSKALDRLCSDQM